MSFSRSLFNRRNFYIQEINLAQALGIGRGRLDEIVETLQSSDDENIRIKELVHFKVQGYVNKYPKRTFSREGAIAIAKYLDTQIEITTPALNKVLELVEQYRVNQIDATVRQGVYENSSSLTVRRQRHWLSYEDVVKIFKTTRTRLDVAFQNIQRSDNPMKIDEDFENQGQSYYFSLSGLEKLSLELSVTLLSEERREYCSRVREVAPPVLKFLTIAPAPSSKDIEQAKRYVKNREKFCQITGVARDKYENSHIELVCHHLYSQKTYSFLADVVDNIITIEKSISEDFHQWNGGNQKSCTIDDFIEYVELRYPQKNETLLMLYNRRSILLVKLRFFQRALPKGNG